MLAVRDRIGALATTRMLPRGPDVGREGEGCIALSEAEMLLVRDLSKKWNGMYGTLKHVHKSGFMDACIVAAHLIVLLSLGKPVSEELSVRLVPGRVKLSPCEVREQ